jgi:dihydroorotase
MEMPNTVPQTLTQELLAAKYEIGARQSVANYSFFMGASNHNLEEVLKTDGRNVCGIKVFMGSSTGDMLVDKAEVLESLFSRVPLLIATHCEKEEIVRANLAKAKEQYGDNIPVEMHPIIRSEEACYASSHEAVSLARKFGARLHVLHISTVRELELFSNALPLEQKRITAEACIHHLWFDAADYATRGNFIKWNPAVKAGQREGILQGVLDNRIDIIATDHAPHTLEEKANPYTSAPSGAPLVQHALQAMLELSRQGKITLERVVEKMCHAPAICFQLDRRGFVREGYHADLVLVDLTQPQTVTRESLLYKCGWSPLEGVTFGASIHSTFVNGHCAYSQGKVDDSRRGMRLLFNR